MTTAFRVAVAALATAAVIYVGLIVAANYGIDIVWPSAEPPPAPKNAALNLDLHGVAIFTVTTSNGKVTWDGDARTCPQANAKFRALQRAAKEKEYDIFPCNVADETKH